MTEVNPLDELLEEAPHSRAAQPRSRRAAAAARAAGPARSRGRLGHRWFAVCALLLFTAADYKFRVRAAADTLQGRPDIAILLEIGIFVGVFLFLVDQFPPSLRVRRMSAPIAAAALLVVIMVLSLARADHLNVEVVRAFEMITVLYLARTLARFGRRIDVENFLHAFLVLVAASVVFGVVYPMPRFPHQEDRFTWLRIHPVTSAVFTGIATLIAVHYLLSGRSSRPGPHWPSIVYAVLGLVVGLGLFESKTRGAVSGTVVGLLVLIWYAAPVRRRIEIAVLIIVAVGAFVLGAWHDITNYLARGESTAQLETLNSRTDLWSVAWHDFLRQPFYGYGLGASHSLFLDTNGLGGAHNAYLNVLVDLGAVGGLAWAWLIGSVVWAAFRVSQRDRSVRVERALIYALVGLLLVNGFTNGGLGDEANVASTLLILLAGWVTVLTREHSVPRRRRAVRPATPPAGTRGVIPSRSSTEATG